MITFGSEQAAKTTTFGSTKRTIMNKHITLVVPVLLAAVSAAFAQSPEQTDALVEPPVTVAPQAPEGKLAPASYEEQLKAAEDRFPLKLSAPLPVQQYINGAPWLAYVIAYDRVMSAKAKSGDAATAGVSVATPVNGGFLGGLPWVAAMTASNQAPIGSSASLNWAYAAAGLMVLDFLSGPTAAQKALGQFKRDGLMKPAIHFVKQDPVPSSRTTAIG